MSDKRDNFGIKWVIVSGLMILFGWCIQQLSDNNFSDVITVEAPILQNDTVIEVPVEVLRIDTLYIDNNQGVIEPVIIEVENPINKDLLEKYNSSMDSIEKLNFYIKAITERKYIEKLEDSIQTIIVESEVIGSLKSQSITYKTKEYKIKIKQPKPKNTYYAGFRAYLPLNGSEGVAIGLTGQMLSKDKKEIYSIGYDSKGRFHFGMTFNIFE